MKEGDIVWIVGDDNCVYCSEIKHIISEQVGTLLVEYVLIELYPIIGNCDNIWIERDIYNDFIQKNHVVCNGIGHFPRIIRANEPYQAPYQYINLALDIKDLGIWKIK